MTCIWLKKRLRQPLMLYTLVLAHFTLSGSREQSAYAGSDERFWPIAGGNTLRSTTNCLDLPAIDPVDVSGTYTARFEIGNGASHIGLCKAFLVNPETGASEEVAEEDNCVSISASLDVDLSGKSCSGCVLRITVAADHMVTTIEDYDSCIDVNVGGGQQEVAAVEAQVATPIEAVETATIPVETVVETQVETELELEMEPPMATQLIDAIEPIGVPTGHPQAVKWPHGDPMPPHAQ